MENHLVNIIKDLCKSNLIAKLNFHKFPSTLSLQERIKVTEIEEKQISLALSVRNKYKLPFWDSLLLTYFDNPDASKTILKEVLNHNKRDNYFQIDVTDSNDLIYYLSEAINNNVAINSKVILQNGQTKHIPLIDFHIPIGSNNENLIEEVLKILGFHSGYLLNSGKSYHFYSSGPLFSEDELIAFLSKSLLFSPIIDRAWVAHQLIEKSCSLRISLKNNKLPELVKIISF